MADGLQRCAHGRYRIDPCVGCGRRYVGGELVGPFLTVGVGGITLTITERADDGVRADWPRWVRHGR